MMKSLRIGLCVLTLACLLLLPEARSGQAQEGKLLLHYIVSGENAMLFNRPEMVCGGEVKQVRWSPGGNYAVAVQDALPPFDPNHPSGESMVSVTVWRSDIHRTRTVWSQPLTSMHIGDGIDWIGKTDIGLLRLTGMGTDKSDAHLLMLMPLRDTVREINADRVMNIYANPTQPMALLEESAINPQTREITVNHFQLLHSDGSLQEAQDFPQPNILLNNWSPDGKMFYATAVIVLKQGRPTQSYYALDAATGTWALTQGRPNMASVAQTAAPKSALRIIRGTGVVEQDGEKRTVYPAWIATDAKSGPSRSLIAADCEEAILSPKGDAVLYRTKEGAFVLPLTKVLAAPFTQMLRQVAVSNAKQVGLGLIMYTQDYDEQFPLAEFSISEVVNPYLKNPDLFEGFTYAYPAKSLANIAKPAETIMGTVAGPGGEAVIYADGHVKWRDKK